LASAAPAAAGHDTSEQPPSGHNTVPGHKRPRDGATTSANPRADAACARILNLMQSASGFAPPFGTADDMAQVKAHAHADQAASARPPAMAGMHAAHITSPQMGGTQDAVCATEPQHASSKAEAARSELQIAKARQGIEEWTWATCWASDGAGADGVNMGSDQHVSEARSLLVSGGSIHNHMSFLRSGLIHKHLCPPAHACMVLKFSQVAQLTAVAMQQLRAVTALTLHIAKTHTRLDHAGLPLALPLLCEIHHCCAWSATMSVGQGVASTSSSSARDAPHWPTMAHS
jgi:hypothetical protein